MQQTDAHPILEEILTFIAARNMAKSKFGIDALGDPGFVWGLENGREPRRKTLARVKSYMLTAPAPASPIAQGDTASAPQSKQGAAG
jgi:hypothetical protein